MNTYSRIMIVVMISVSIGIQTGCDQHEFNTEAAESEILAKGDGIADLGARLARDGNFKAFQKRLIQADRKARLKYFAGADLEQDLAFAKQIEKKSSLTTAEKSRVKAIRALSQKELEKLHDLRNKINDRFPELRTLTKEELREVLSAAGVGQGQSLGKTLDACSACNYAYNSCISTAEFRHAIEVMSCSIFLTSVFGGTVCYLASVSKFMWTISSCNSTRQYCLSNNGCLNTAGHDTA